MIFMPIKQELGQKKKKRKMLLAVFLVKTSFNLYGCYG
uniref:Uncharacterized protein n=1 Tax=Rhizophora mucronata TaxID=61149 RepID=A0A2P2P6N9_RHIMU